MADASCGDCPMMMITLEKAENVGRKRACAALSWVARRKARAESRRHLQTTNALVTSSQFVAQTRPEHHVTPIEELGNTLKTRHTNSSRLRNVRGLNRWGRNADSLNAHHSKQTPHRRQVLRVSSSNFIASSSGFTQRHLATPDARVCPLCDAL